MFGIDNRVLSAEAVEAGLRGAIEGVVGAGRYGPKRRIVISHDGKARASVHHVRYNKAARAAGIKMPNYVEYRVEVPANRGEFHLFAMFGKVVLAHEHKPPFVYLTLMDAKGNLSKRRTNEDIY